MVRSELSATCISWSTRRKIRAHMEPERSPRRVEFLAKTELPKLSLFPLFFVKVVSEEV